MRRRLVLWGSNAQDEKVLLGLELMDNENKVKISIIPEADATEAFYTQMMNMWRNDSEVLFPESTLEIERNLSVSEDILPEDLKVDRTDLILRAKAEWHFVVLSAKLYEIYKTEIDDLKEKVENLQEYDDQIWEELKGFWEKVQHQMKEKNIFREHAESLKNKTNGAFDKLKELRKVVEKKFREESREKAEVFKKELNEIEEKVEKGLGLKPIFEELKDIQKKFKNETFSRKDQNTIWNKIDSLFKVVKEKRFGNKEKTGNSPLGRLQRRYDGLMSAMDKMQRSIVRDKKEIDFQNKRINTTDGQLEMQIRQAKLHMIEERIKSKTEKLEDMQKTKIELDAKMQVEKKREEELIHKEEVKKKQEEIKEKIASQMADSNTVDEETARKLEKAAKEMKEEKAPKIKASHEIPTEGKEEEVNAEKPGVVESNSESDKEPVVDSHDPKMTDQKEDILDQAETVISNITETIGESVEDIVTGVKAVMEVLEDRVEEFIEDFKDEEE